MFDEVFTRIPKAQNFPDGYDWINVKEPLSLEKLKGRIIILDFWTYCCINCMHMLPVLAALEKKYKDKPVVFIGVHSAKFFNEQDKKNIENAVARYEISHPVVVDRNMSIWRKYDVSGWPTIIIIDPNGTIVYKQSGEGQKESIEDTVDVLLEKHSKTRTLAKEPLHIEHKISQNKTTLSFPGKISISKDKIALSDSNHNRIIVTDLSGKIEHIVGNGKIGFSDGGFETATFFRPQGVVWKNDSIIVADTENHAIRKIDMIDKKVTTLVGTGHQGPWISQGGKGKEISITSPWDLAQKDNLIFIAMAGNHQIWTYDMESDIAKPFAGNGYENIIDGEKQHAQLAQPSGLSISGTKLYFADSEVSAIREIDLETNQVKTIVGHGLFVFGHKDGNIDEALFQHPLGVYASKNKIYVADTYNSAIREIDLETNQVKTIVGKTEMNGTCRLDDPACDSLGLYEPSDVELFQNKMYITDTNNHLVRVYDMNSNVLQTLEIKI
ncbi:MAG TPA: thioredoxin-like domain-containing protein [Nitrosopumilaceae archaeon]|nr:thioredoxin-like domain-containing protein [Nitrosopumilaceae archaeon]